MNWRFCIGLMAGVLLLAGATCTRVERGPGADPEPTEPAAEGESLRIGVLYPKKGPYAEYGKAVLYGTRVAASAARGRYDLRVDVVDGGFDGNPDHAVAVFRRLIRHERVLVVVGPVSSQNALVVAAAAEEAKFPLVVPTATAYEVTAGRPHVLRVCFLDPLQGTAMALFARKDLGFDRVLILSEAKSAYSEGLANAFRSAFTSLGGTILDERSYPSGQRSWKKSAEEIAALEPDAVFLPGYFRDAGRFVKAFREAGAKAPVLGGDGWDNVRFFEFAGGQAEGNYYCTHFTPEDELPVARDFVLNFQHRYHRLPGAMEALGYDALLLAAAAAKRAGLDADPEKLLLELASTKDFHGATGRISLDDERNPIKPAVVLRTEALQAKFHKRIRFGLGR